MDAPLVVSRARNVPTHCDDDVRVLGRASRLVERAGIDKKISSRASAERNDGACIIPSIDDGELVALLAGTDEALVLAGHTHDATDHTIDGRRLVKPGTVSNPPGLDKRASDALLHTHATGSRRRTARRRLRGRACDRDERGVRLPRPYLADRPILLLTFRQTHLQPTTCRPYPHVGGVPMEVFISWSGERSKRIADAFAELLTKVFPGRIEPFVSDRIKGGERWHDELQTRMERSSAIVFCLTPESIDSPWIAYEAGYVAALGKGELHPFVYHAEAPGPLNHLQAASLDRKSVRDMIESLLAQLGEGDRPGALVDIDASFDEAWPDFDRSISELVTMPVSQFVPDDLLKIFDGKSFGEPFETCRDQSWSARFDRSSRAFRALDGHARARQILSTDERLDGLRADLTRLLDRYTMLIRGSLLQHVEWADVDEQAQRELTSCRRDILNVLRELGEPPHALPVIRASVGFVAADTASRKSSIDRHRHQLNRGEFDQDQLENMATSEWDLDRIVHSMAWQYGYLELSLAQGLDRIRQEENRARTRQLRRGLQPLYYATRAFDERIRAEPDTDVTSLETEIRDAIDKVRRFVDKDAGRDESGHIADRLDSISRRLGASSEP